MSDRTVVGLVLALASAFVINFAYLREHEAAAELPVLSMRRPLQSARLLLSDRSWLLGFVMESGGFLLYVAALGGIGILAFASARMAKRRLAPQELAGVLLSVLGLVALPSRLWAGRQRKAVESCSRSCSGSE